MASPTVASVATATDDAATTSHTITYPATVASGDVLFSIISGDSSAASFSSWGDSNTELFDTDEGTINFAGAYKKADGTEDSGTFTVTSAGSDESTHQSFAIAGAEDPATQAPEASTGVTGDSDSPDAGSVTPTGGSKDYLFAFFAGWDQKTRDMDGFPSGYTNTGFFQFSGGASGCSHGRGFKAATATSEDPGAALLSGSEGWVAFCVAFHPPGAGGGDEYVPMLAQRIVRHTGWYV